jgi:hypothetical protein
LRRGKTLTVQANHPLADFAPTVITQSWIAEVSRFAEEFEGFLDQIRVEYPDQVITSEAVIAAFDRGLGKLVRRDYLAACHEYYWNEAHDLDLWWDDAEPVHDLVDPLVEIYEVTRRFRP